MMSATCSELEWELEATRLVSSLVIPLVTLQSIPDEATDALWDAVEEIHSATATGLHWSHSHLSRDPETARHLKRLFSAQSLALMSAGEAMRRRAQGRGVLATIEADIDESMVAVGESLCHLRARLPIP